MARTAKKTNNSSGAVGYYEPSTTVQFLPRCRACGASHPLARRPPRPEGLCPDCGAAAAQPGRAMHVGSEITRADPILWLGGKLLSIGKQLFLAGKRIRK